MMENPIRVSFLLTDIKSFKDALTNRTIKEIGENDKSLTCLKPPAILTMEGVTSWLTSTNITTIRGSMTCSILQYGYTGEV